MQRVRIKTADGAWADKDMSGVELEAWFKDHTKDGAVTEDIELFREAAFQKSEGEDGIDWVMSDMSIDRDMERVDPEGADFRNFKKNPVVLWAHDHDIPAIGKVQNPKIKDGAVRGKVVFDTVENDPFAAMIGRKVKSGIISAGSIGFKPNNVEFIEESKDPTRLIHRKWELMEFSICNVPAHPGALAQRDAEAEGEKEAPNAMKEKLMSLEGRIQALEVEIQKQVEGRKTYLDSLFSGRGETSCDKATGSGSSILFDPGETSQGEVDGSLSQLIGGSNG